MDTFKNIISLLGAFAIGLMLSKGPANLSGNVDTDFFVTSFSATSTNVSTSKVLVLDAQADRQYAKICVDSLVLNQPIYLHLTNSSSTVATSTGIALFSAANPSGDPCFVIGKDFKYTGQVWAIGSTTVTQKLTTEYHP